MEIPTCCGKGMKVKLETSTYTEVECEVCKDVVYVKKAGTKPTLLDD